MSMVVYELVRDFGITAMAAFAGGWAAIFVESRRERRREEGRRYLALRLAHFATLSQYQELVGFRENVLGPYKGNDAAWRLLIPSLAKFTTPKFSPEDLVFTLEGSDPDLLNRLTVGQQKFETFRGTLELRNEAHRSFQARMASLQKEGVVVASSEDEIHRLVGRDIIGALKGTTAALFGGVTETIPVLKKSLDDLETLARVEFPRRRTPKFELLVKDNVETR